MVFFIEGFPNTYINNNDSFCHWNHNYLCKSCDFQNEAQDTVDELQWNILIGSFAVCHFFLQTHVIKAV